jgi:hypothetical protein
MAFHVKITHPKPYHFSGHLRFADGYWCYAGLMEHLKAGQLVKIPETSYFFVQGALPSFDSF